MSELTASAKRSQVAWRLGAAAILGLSLVSAAAPQAAAVGAGDSVQVKKLDPPQGGILTRTPKALRVWFDRQPDPAESLLTLEGPGGKMRLEGLHTMGYEDLMISVVGRLPDGDYLARWRFTGLDGTQAVGEWRFAIVRDE